MALLAKLCLSRGLRRSIWGRCAFLYPKMRLSISTLCSMLMSFCVALMCGSAPKVDDSGHLDKMQFRKVIRMLQEIDPAAEGEPSS